MKFKLSFMLAVSFGLMAGIPSLAQEVNTVDARTSQMAYRPNEVIVKFKETSKVDLVRTRSGVATLNTAAVKKVDNVFNKLGVTETMQLMPLTQDQTFKTLQKGFTGKTVEARPIKKAFKLTIDPEKISVHEAVQELKQLEDVEYAEPNYIVYALEAEAPDDPYYDLQYGIKDINLDKLWGEPVLTKEGPIIAILDTGVDITHPDLAANIWTNEKEISGAIGYDDDGNGFVDDIHGWDFVNQTGEIYDYNGHGTHCAGIAAACGFNGLGIVGANPDAKIMPLTVLQSNGQGDMATIIKAIDYAVANGAGIISMSLGSYSQSIALEEALGRAYQKSMIVAAAGNDGYCLNHAHPKKAQFMPMPMFPGAYSFVLGVQASGQTGELASFSNYDDNGPTFSEYGEEKLYNYELTVPGVSIMSTYPGGGYKQLNGTSMATPLVAGALSRLLQAKEYTNKEELFGDLIHCVTDKGNLDIYASYCISDSERIPEIQFVTFEMVDADSDGRADAGEVVEFYPVIRNTWGNVKDIKLTIDCAETVNNTFEIINGQADFGLNLSSYGKGKSVNPLKIKLNDNVVDGRIVRMKFTAEAPNAGTIEQELEIRVENAVELTGILKEDMTLYPDQQYIVKNTFGVPEGKTLTILPGCTLKFRDNSTFSVEGKLIANGEPGKMIIFTKEDFDTGVINSLNFGNNTFSYCIIENLIGDIRHYAFYNYGLGKNCIFRNCTISNLNYWEKSLLYRLSSHVLMEAERSLVNYSNLTDVNIRHINPFKEYGIFTGSNLGVQSSNVLHNFYDNVPFSFHLVGNMEIFTPEMPCYVGTSNKDLAQNCIIDINHPYSSRIGVVTEYDFSNMPERPIAEAPGIVWKVVVNGYDAQDEFDLLPPLGVGTHKFEVYFNRQMNKEVTPTLAMGIRPPYTSITIGEEGSWNDAGDVYTAYLTINGKSNYDGLNRIYVDGAEDDEFFPIPVEDSRFNVMVQAAGSLSEGFMAEAGLGRVNLEWDNTEEEFDDMLGLNMYRYTINEEGLAGDTIQINRQLIEPKVTTLTDYDVKPRQTYAYFYKVMRTDLAETSPSKTVAVTPMTATQGDANGSGEVDVADVITTVNYASGLDPKPFIFEAADMNADNEIDILDVVNIIRTILSPSSMSLASANEPAYYFVDKNGVLYLETSVALAGIQLNLSIAANGNVIASNVLDGFEKTGAWVGEDLYKYMVYSLNGKYLEPGIYAVAKITGLQDIDIRLSDVIGQNVEVLSRTGETDTTQVDFIESQDTSVTGIYTITGVKVGNHLGDLDGLPHGIYIVNGHKVVK